MTKERNNRRIPESRVLKNWIIELRSENQDPSDEAIKSMVIDRLGFPHDLIHNCWSCKQKSYKGKMRSKRCLFRERFGRALELEKCDMV